jgi:hypothetical protein
MDFSNARKSLHAPFQSIIQLEPSHKRVTGKMIAVQAGMVLVPNPLRGDRNTYHAPFGKKELLMCSRKGVVGM